MSRVDGIALHWGLRRVLPGFIVEQKGPLVIGPTTQKPLEKKKKSQVACLSNDGLLWVLICFQRRRLQRTRLCESFRVLPAIFEQRLMINRLSPQGKCLSYPVREDEGLLSSPILATKERGNSSQL